MTEETIKEILKFRDDREWKQFHNPKDLAISISVEAAELLEVFQWSGADVSNEGKQEKIKEELADVVNYCVLMADTTLDYYNKNTKKFVIGIVAVDFRTV